MPAPTDESARAGAELLAAARQLVADQVRLIRDGDDWAQFLMFQAALHDLTAENVLLVVAQHQGMYEAGTVNEATPRFVATRAEWRSAGYDIRPGQRGIAVIGPDVLLARRVTEPSGTTWQLSGDDAPGAAVGHLSSGMPQIADAARVWSDAQVTGPPIPSARAPRLLSNEAPAGLATGAAELIASRRFRLVLPAGDPGAAMVDFESRIVTVPIEGSAAAVTCALVRQAAHTLLHDPEASSSATIHGRTPSAIADQLLEAESVAAVVTTAHGMVPAAPARFGRVADWPPSLRPEMVANTAGRVARAARDVIRYSTAPRTAGGCLPRRAASVLPAAPATPDVGLRL